MALLDLSQLPFSAVTALVTDPHLNLSYAQEAEDLLLARMMGDRIRQPGFYVDVGAHHPRRFSNTWFLYLLGWRGVNIDARSGMKEDFAQERPEDINLEMAIGPEETILSLHYFDEPAMNTFDGERARNIDEKTQFNLLGQMQVPSAPLHTVLERDDVKALAANRGGQIGLLSVDIEGFDLVALETLDWARWHPEYILVEDDIDLEKVSDSAIWQFLKGKGYKLYSKLYMSCLYIPDPNA